MLIGNKADIENKREVTKEMANEFCERNNIKIFMEASAKTGYNVDNIFKEATKILLEQHQKQKIYIYRPESMRHIEYHEEELDKTRTKEIVLSERNYDNQIHIRNTKNKINTNNLKTSGNSKNNKNVIEKIINPNKKKIINFERGGGIMFVLLLEDYLHL